MKNTTLAMVAVLAAVAMLSAGLAVAPMQQASATDGDSKVKTGDNKVKIKQSNECEEVLIACGNFLKGKINQNTGQLED
jgi:hypothetical protein